MGALLFQYIKMHRKGIGIFFLFSLIFLIVFALYRLPWEAVVYAAVLCGFIGILFLLPDYRRYCSKCRRLLHMQEDVGMTLERLPEAGDEPERLYQELLQILYRQKQQSMDESNRRYQELTDYYTIWAHQIKTPIAAMDLILQKAADEERPCREEGQPSADIRQNGQDEGLLLAEENAVRQLSEELKRIRQYVDMVLVVLRLDSDSTDYVIREYDLDDILRQAVKKYAAQFIYKKLSLRYEPINRRVLTDEKWLLFVVEQVLSNALKYTRTGFIEIYMEEPETLCIRDTGIGIAQEDLPRIFEKSYTGYNGRSDKKASGIGLYLSRRICGKLGHTITAVSTVGEGTTIRIGLARQEIEFE